MARKLGLALLALVAYCAFVQTTNAETIHVVGDSFGWVAPLGGPFFYASWAASQTFSIGDILLFNFTTGQEDVARVRKEAFLTCNSTAPISLKTNGPANFTLDSLGEYYFIGTMNRRCIIGQKLAINVTAQSGPTPAPTPRGPKNYTVGDDLGWLIPPSPFFYAAWAHNKTFFIGDTLVFNFLNGADNVVVVTKEVFESCNTSSMAVFNSTPAIIPLNTIGGHYYTSTFARRCILGQKLAVNVTGNSNHSPAPKLH